MKIFITAQTMAKEDKVEKKSETEYKVSVKEPPIQGRANRAIARVLAEYFNVSVTRVNLVSGFASRQKIFEILL